MVFVWGKSAPIWGRYGGLKFGIFANFGLLLLGTLSTDFRFFDGVRQLHRCSNDPENFVKFKFVEFEQWGSKFGGWGIFGFWAHSPKLTHVSYSPDDPEKDGFCLGGNRPPFGGDMGVRNLAFFWAFWRTLAYFCSELCRQIFDVLTAFDSHTCPLTMLKI